MNNENEKQVKERPDAETPGLDPQDNFQPKMSENFDMPPRIMPEINPEEERIFGKRDVLKMILGGYISMLPAFLAMFAALLLVLLLFG